MPLTSFAGESGLIAFVTTAEEKKLLSLGVFPPGTTKLSYNLLTCLFTGRNFIISP